MIDSVVFIGAAIIAATQVLKLLVPAVNGAVTIVVAALLGALVGGIDIHIGLDNISVAQGVLTGLAAVGVHTTAAQVGGKSTTPSN